MNALEYLATELNISTNSRLRAVQEAGELAFDPDTYRRVIGELTGSEDVNVGDDEAKFAFMYLVEEIVAGQKTDSIDIASAESKAIKFVKNNPWVLAKPDEDDSYYTPKSTVDALGQPKQKKGAKKIAAIRFWKDNQSKFKNRKEWITALAENIGLTEAAASTYHYNLRKGIWS